MRTNANYLNTQKAGSLIESRVRDAKLTMKSTGANLLAESRLSTPRGLGLKLKSLPPVTQAGKGKRVGYCKISLIQWTESVLIPYLRHGGVLENSVNLSLQSSLSATPSEIKPVQEHKEGFLGELIELSFKFANNVISHNTYDRIRYAAIEPSRLKSTIALDVIHIMTGVDILKEFRLTHAPH